VLARAAHDQTVSHETSFGWSEQDSRQARPC